MLRIGIVGLPNVGKSTLFKALTKKQVPAENYPFCTIDPNVGVVPVPDERLTLLAKMSASKKVLPAVIEFVDIAGLVKGASRGEGLGNKFLSYVREVDAILHLSRFFSDKNVTHVYDRIDPKDDIGIIHYELIMADLEVIKNRVASIERAKKSGNKESENLEAIVKKIKIALEEGKLASSLNFDEKEKQEVKHLNLLTLKPILHVLNTDETFSGDIPDVLQVLHPIFISAKIESELTELADDEAKMMLEELGMQESGLDRLARSAYEVLGLISFLTTGEKETRAWTIPLGTTAQKAAGVIHSDFEKGFIRAEIIDWKKLLELGNWKAAKERGMIRQEGREYIMQDGNVVEFLVG